MMFLEGLFKTEKVNLRITKDEQALLDQAAKRCHTIPTLFILEEAIAAAEDVVEDQVRFVLTKEEWETLEATLVSSPKLLACLYRKREESTLWDVPTNDSAGH